MAGGRSGSAPTGNLQSETGTRYLFHLCYRENVPKAEQNQRTFHLRKGNIGNGCSFAETLLARKVMNAETANEAFLVFEALMQNSSTSSETSS